LTGAVIGGRVRSSQVCAGRQSGRKVCSTLYFHRCSEKATLPAVQNRLIELLPRTARLSLLKICEPIELKLSQVLSEPGAPTRHVYFPTTGFVSLVSLMGGPGVEVGMVGREGMVGAHLALDEAIAFSHAVVQGPGGALRIRSGPFRKELAGSAPLQRALKRYLYVLMVQLATASSCARFHLLSPRLARWLLMTQDRTHSKDFPVTQQFLAYVLGVRRVGVSAAASALQQRRLIEYQRGNMTVLDRKGLEAAACGCYAADLAAYARSFR